MLRDSEIEEVLAEFLAPALRKVPEIHRVRMYVIVTDSINAFATPNQEIFCNTGLIASMDSVEELIAVLYHELGHIAGKHWISRVELLSRTQNRSILSTLLGLLAAGLLRDVRAFGFGNIGQYWAYADLMGYSRTQESSADQFALHVLSSLKWSMDGFLAMMEKLGKKDSVYSVHPYLRTHPFSKDRMMSAHYYKEKLEQKNILPMPHTFSLKFSLIKTKIIAHLTDLAGAFLTIEKLPVPQIMKDYGKAIVHYRLGQWDKALQILDPLRNNPVFTTAFIEELRAQILVDARRIPEAKEAIDQAVKHRPRDMLLASFKAHILTMMDNPEALKEAVKTLEQLLFVSEPSPEVWYRLGIVYGKLQKFGPMRVCLAECALHENDLEKAQFHIDEALKILPMGDPYEKKAKDFRDLLKNIKEERRRNPKGALTQGNAGRPGFEPGLHGPEPSVLPLDDLPKTPPV